MLLFFLFGVAVAQVATAVEIADGRDIGGGGGALM